MSFGISNSVRSRAVRTCTPELFWKCMRSDYVATVCAGIADVWEQWKRGELSKEEFEEIKNREKKRLPIFTFHATFPSGRRLNADAVPTGLSIYDIDHLDAPREYFDHLVGERVRQLGIVLAHVTPSMRTSRPRWRGCAWCSASPRECRWPRRNTGCPPNWATRITTKASRTWPARRSPCRRIISCMSMRKGYS